MMKMNMKRLADDDLDKLQKPLSAAYHRKENIDIGGLWHVRVMGHIRSLPPLYSQTGYWDHLARLVWHLSPAAVILVLLLGAAMLQIDVTSEYEIAKMFVEDPLDLSLLGDYTI